VSIAYYPPLILIWIGCFLEVVCFGQISETQKYLGQTVPGVTPKIFAPGIISMPTESEFGSVFSEDGSEFFYGVDAGGKSEIRFSSWRLGTWTEPMVVVSHKAYGYNDPFLSPDENELFFISNQPFDQIGPIKDHDIWYATRQPDGWSEPINPGQNINSGRSEYYISFTSDGTMYFASNRNAAEERKHDFDIYVSEWVGGQFQPAVRLGDSINSKAYEADVFIEPDESFMIFCAIRREGLGQGDLYISFKGENGSWTQAQNMGDKINSEHHELCPFVTRDGRFLFYTSKQDIYWVDADVIEQYRIDHPEH